MKNWPAMFRTIPPSVDLVNSVQNVAEAVVAMTQAPANAKLCGPD